MPANRFRLIPRKLYNLFLLLIILPSTGHSTLLNQYLFETWTSRDGLPHNSINAIAQTSDGYLWFATWEGIARFNGREFTHFTRGEQSGMLDSGTRALSADKFHGLLAGGVRGSLVYRQPDNWQALGPAESLINALLIEADGSVWTGLQGKGLTYRSGLNGEDQNVLSDTNVYELTQRRNGDILASTNKGLYLISARNHIQNTLIETEGKAPVYTAAETAQGEILLGGDNGLWRYHKGSLSRISSELNELRVSRIMISQDEAIWLGTFNQGLFRYHKARLDSLTETDGLPHSRILSIFEDREKSVWIGTNSGLIRLRQAPFSNWDRKRGLTGDYVRSVLVNNDGRVLVGSSSGLSIIHKDQAEKVQLSDDSPEQVSVLSLSPRLSGGNWVGTYNDGLFVLNEHTLTPFPVEGLPAQEIRAILQLKDGTLWLGTTAGLVRYREDAPLLVLTVQDGLADDYVMALSQDPQGRIWAGTGKGVSVIESEKVRSLNLTSMEKAEYVFGFLSHPDAMWMTTDRGLIRYRYTDKSLGLVGRKHGLPIDKLFQAVADDQGFFWLTSNRGIWRVTVSDAELAADGSLEQIDFEHFSELDGLASAQINGGSSPAATIDPSGTLWFATAKGAASTHPNRFGQLVSPHFPVSIESVRAGQEHLSAASDTPAEIAPGNNRVSFEYVGLGYVFPQDIRYKTRLEGLEREWIERGTLNTAEYTNLDPGDYRFVVSAYYPYQENGVNQASFRFTILPYWWQRSGVRALIALLIASSIGLTVWLRLRALKRSERRLKLQVAAQTKALKKQTLAFERQARADQLTGLANRRAFDEWISTLKKKQNGITPLSVIMLDIDHFKQINDTRNHIVGDHVLKQVAHSLKALTPGSAMLARWGGEEFVLGIPSMSADEVEALCSSMNQAIREGDYSAFSPDLKVTISIGIVHGQCADDFDLLLRQADSALLEVKRTGRDALAVYQSSNPEQ